MTDEQLLADAKDAFALCEEAEAENRAEALDDLRFAKLGEQWPEHVRLQRIKDGRPCLTINRQPAFIRQVVNEARQNRPSIKVHPVDSEADPAIAEIYDGLIRNIERTSKADVAYDTAVDGAVSNGFGYFRINTDYADEGSFDLDLKIERIANPFSVYGDPLSTASDSSDWTQCFVTEVLSHEAFKARFKNAEAVNWSDSGYVRLPAPWAQEKSVLVAEWWRRERVKRPIVALSDGTVLEASVYAKQKDVLDAQGVTVLGEREALTHKVTQTVLTGAEVLEKNDWAGKYIPIVPVYGDEVNIEGKRHFRSLIRDAKDAQRMLNYWRTASTELTALAPRVPFIGRKALAFAASAKGATQGDGPADQLVPYATARQALIKTGYHPLVLRHGDDDYFCGEDDLCRTYPEVLSCAVAGAPACRMAFFNSVERKYLLVLTNSDRTSGMMAVARMDVTNFDIADIKQRQ
jgi:hypothetical protein